MVKGKAIKKALSEGVEYAKDRGAKGAGIVAVEKVIDVVDNPYLAAAEGAALGFAVGGPVGALAGGAIGWLLADELRIAPCDLVAIPSYRYASMLQGTPPTFQIFIKEGEMIAPVTPTDTMKSEAVVSGLEQAVTAKPRKLSAWNRYVKNKKNAIKFKSGKKKGQLNLKAMARAYRRGRK